MISPVKEELEIRPYMDQFENENTLKHFYVLLSSYQYC